MPPLLASSGAWDTFLAELLSQHYDPAYFRSTGSHYARLGRAEKITVEPPADHTVFADLARSVMSLRDHALPA